MARTISQIEDEIQLRQKLMDAANETRNQADEAYRTHREALLSAHKELERVVEEAKVTVQ